MPQLGKLEKVRLRETWKTEAQDFTPWLAKPENIAILGDALGMELEVKSVEESVGLFRADIVCTDIENDTHVLIENQLERTDHGHLGQIITYAAGTDAATIVWISKRFTEEHRAALDWLNEHTRDNVQFFGIQVELWKIGNSDPAPRFNIVSKPNNWVRAVVRASNEGNRALTEIREIQLKYWTEFGEYLEGLDTGLIIRTPKPYSHKAFSIGRSGFHLSVVTNTFHSWIRAELYISIENAKEYFLKLQLNDYRLAPVGLSACFSIY